MRNTNTLQADNGNRPYRLQVSPLRKPINEAMEEVNNYQKAYRKTMGRKRNVVGTAQPVEKQKQYFMRESVGDPANRWRKAFYSLAPTTRFERTNKPTELRRR